MNKEEIKRDYDRFVDNVAYKVNELNLTPEQKMFIEKVVINLQYLNILLQEKENLIKYLENEIEYRKGSDYDVEIDERHMLEVVLKKVSEDK